jgi:hypothetical protein
MGLTPVSLVFGRELETAQQPAVCGIPDKELPTIDYPANLVNHLHDIHNYAREHLKPVSDRRKLVMIDWPTAWATTRAMTCGYIGPPA